VRIVFIPDGILGTDAKFADGITDVGQKYKSHYMDTL
jgi:hypothetical protein